MMKAMGWGACLDMGWRGEGTMDRLHKCTRPVRHFLDKTDHFPHRRP